MIISFDLGESNFIDWNILSLRMKEKITKKLGATRLIFTIRSTSKGNKNLLERLITDIFINAMVNL